MDNFFPFGAASGDATRVGVSTLLYVPLVLFNYAETNVYVSSYAQFIDNVISHGVFISSMLECVLAFRHNVIN